jgi:hypothetical protein
MRGVNHFSLRPSARGAEGLSELWSSENKLPMLVPGTQLEAQYAVGDAADAVFLLLTSYDAPFEESIQVLLLNHQGELVEQAQLGGPYTPGILKDLRVVSPESLSFDFQGPVLVTVHGKRGGWWRPKRLQVTRPAKTKDEP